MGNVVMNGRRMTRQRLPGIGAGVALGGIFLLVSGCGGGATASQNGAPAIVSPSVSGNSAAASAPAPLSAAPVTSAPLASAASKLSPSAAAKPAAGTPPADPCSLITTAEAEAALGLKFDHTSVARAGSALGGHGSDCNYEGALPLDPSFTLHTMTADEFQSDRSIPISQWVSISKSNKALQPVDGLGDSAFWNPTLQVLDLTKRTFWIELLATDTKKQFQFKLDAATALAQKAVNRL